MNRRIVIVDDDPKEGNFNVLDFCGIGAGEFYTTTQLEGRTEKVEVSSVDPQTGEIKVSKVDKFIPPSYTEEQIQGILGTIGNGDAALLVGPVAFRLLQKWYHFGVRNENYFDCSKLKRLSIEGGAFVKCCADLPEEKEINYFLSQDIVLHKDFSWFKQFIIHDVQNAISFIQHMDTKPSKTKFGFDYEGSGMPWDVWYEVSGFSLCDKTEGAFISLTDIRNTCSRDEYNNLMFNIVAPFLLKRMKYIWVYNMSYEYQVSHRIMGVDLYNLCDASVFNVLSGNHTKKYSLKWSANMYLESTVWDTEFDRISDLIDSMLFTVEGKLKKDQKKVIKVTLDNYQSTPEWAELQNRYPAYISEFERLIKQYWGNPFMCIPSEILGYYCNLDAFYTLMICETEAPKYTEEAIDVFMDNIRLQTTLHSCGINKWEEFRSDYSVYCLENMAFGITYCATARCKIKMYKHQAKMADIKKYPKISQVLLKKNKFFDGNAVDIAKYLLTDNVDVMDAYDYGVNEGKVMMDYGPDFVVDFMDIVRDSMEEAGFIKLNKKTGAKVIKNKIEPNVGGKKKLLSIVAEKLKPILGLDKIKIDNKHIELEKYLYYEAAYNELKKVSKNQLNNPLQVPSEIKAFGQKFDLLGYSDYISDNYFKCKSPIENDEICLEFAELYPTETAYLAAIYESSQQLNNAEKYYETIGIKTVEDGYAHFMSDWQTWCNALGNNQTYESKLYPQKMFDLSLLYWRNITKRKKDEKVMDQVKEVWDNFNGYKAQEDFFKYVSSDCTIYEIPFEDNDLENNFGFMRKLVVNYLLYKKYSKVLTTYIGIEVDGERKGMFLASDKWVIENPKNHVVIREATGPDEPGAVRKMFSKFQCMEKSSKRWSSGYHTIISHADFKSIVKAYPGHLLSYFDISSAEVKSAGFQSEDPDLIDKFVNGIDIYIYTAKLYLGEEGWNKLPGDKQKMWRKRFKTIFLGILYGLGKKSLAERLNCSEAEAEIIINSVYKAFPKLREYVAKQQQYPFEHDGCIRTFFGDRLQVDEWKWYQKATSNREKKNLEARIQRLGVNLPIQGGTSTAMSSGFYNDLRIAKEKGWNLTSFITVHDSNTCNFPVSKLWELRSFYDTNFTEFCYQMTGIKLLFDLEIGVGYGDTCSMKQISDDIVEMKGTARSLLLMIEHMNQDPNLKYEISMPLEDIKPNYISDPMTKFIREKGCQMVRDESKYTVQFKKIS